MKNNNHPFDLVILDLDGTVLNPLQASAISPAVAAAVEEVQQAGIALTIGTGRTLDLMRPYAQQLGITLPVVTTQGAVVADPVTGKIFEETLMPIEAAVKVANWVDESGRTTVFYYSEPGGHVTVYQNNMSGDDAFYDHVFGSPRNHTPNFTELVRSRMAVPPVKFITVNDGHTEKDITSELADRFQQLTITRTHEQLVEGTAKGINKGVGLQKLCSLLKIDPKNVLAIGDNDNDIPMLEVAGFSIAMGNGSSGTKAVANWVAPPITEDGAAIALRKWVLGVE